VVVSRAHFLHSDPSLLDAVEGLNPDPKKHEFLWLIDPVNSAKKFSKNMIIK